MVQNGKTNEMFTYIVLFTSAICVPIERIRNGWVDGGGNLKGDTLSFRCKADYVLEGEHNITCIGHLRWNHKKPTCKGW